MYVLNIKKGELPLKKRRDSILKYDNIFVVQKMILRDWMFSMADLYMFVKSRLTHNSSEWQLFFQKENTIKLVGVFKISTEWVKVAWWACLKIQN